MARRSGVPGRRTLLLATVLAALVALGPAAGSAEAVKLTFIGDSKAAGIEYSAEAKRLLARGHTVRRDLKVCRRLVAQGCVYQGVRPRSALQAIRYYGTGLGTVLVVDVGYNDSSATYRTQLQMVVKAARNRGVKGIVWVNLRAVRPDYKKINAIIAQEAQRRPIIYLANWNAYTRGKPASWFGNDGIHLTGAGAVGLVKLIRRYIPLAAEGPRDTVAREVAAGPAEEPEAPPAEAPPTTTGTDEDDAELTANSPPVGPNLGGPGDGSTGLSGFLPFAGGAALMLFLILVTVKRSRVA